MDEGRGYRCPACNRRLPLTDEPCPCGGEALTLFDGLYDGHYPPEDDPDGSTTVRP